MRQKTLIAFSVFVFSANMIFGQFIVKDVFMETTGLSNQGLVVGYVNQAGPYSIWNPDLDTTIDIGGLAPGLGIGGEAHFSDDGNIISGTSRNLNGLAELSSYNLSIGQWSTLGNLGFVLDSTVSGGFNISGDGNTVVGNSWADTTGGFVYAHAVAWTQTEGLIDLGSLFSNIGASTRADAVSYDGSVIVGWQDFNGPWKSAVWRKNPSGGYYPNEYLLIDTAGSPTDEFNQLGECSAVSADGNWIGGFGDFANNNEPWIWSQDSGVINLGLLPGATQGFVADINADGSIVVGWFDAGFGDPQIPFIWTHSGGLQNLNDYIQNVLGYSMAPYQIYTANCMSSNGMYVAGYGVDTATFNYFAYRVSLTPSTGIKNVSIKNEIKVYPNPCYDRITIEYTGSANLTLTDITGKIIDRFKINGNQVLDISKLNAGIYSLSIQSNDSIETRKIVKY